MLTTESYKYSRRAQQVDSVMPLLHVALQFVVDNLCIELFFVSGSYVKS